MDFESFYETISNSVIKWDSFHLFTGVVAAAS